MPPKPWDGPEGHAEMPGGGHVLVTWVDAQDASQHRDYCDILWDGYQVAIAQALWNVIGNSYGIHRRK